MAQVTPLIANGTLTITTGTEQQSISVGSSDWWHWLNTNELSTFHFKDLVGSFTARREQKSGNWYWYAYRKHQGKLYKAYLGKTEELAPARLQSVAAYLSKPREKTPTTFSPTRTGKVKMSQRQPALESSKDKDAHASRPPLLATKFFLPPARPNLVLRPRLIEQLNAGLQHQLTLISAPAGSGKTTLLSTWCTTLNSTVPHVWLSLDSADNDPMRFLSYVVAALEKVLPAIDHEVQPLLQTLSPYPFEAVLTALINTLTTFPQHLVLILDDYHVITNQMIHDNITFLLDHLPHNLHLFITTRNDPPFPLTRLRARGQLSELRANDLRFNRDEILAFLRPLLGSSLSSEQIAMLDTHTEGWIAGLQLAALSLQGRKDTAQFIASFTGKHRYILDYLSGEVLHRQPEQIRDFLLQTSILNRLNADLCNSITGQKDGQTMLERLEQTNLFLIPLDDQRRWYRYHHLFAEFLRERLSQSHPELVPILHSRASQWYEHFHLMNEAIDHAMAAQDMDRAADLIERYTQTMMIQGEVTTFVHWFSSLPQEIVRPRLRLQLMQAGSLVTIGQLDSAQRLIEGIEQALQTDPEATKNISFMGELFSVRTALMGFRGNLAETISNAQKARQLLPADYLFMHSVIAASLGNAYLITGDLSKASEAFLEAVSLGISGDNLQASLASMAAHGYLQAAYGQLHQAAKTHREAIRIGTTRGGYVFPVVSMAYVCLADLLCEWDQLDEAEQYAQQGIQIGKHWGYVGMLGEGHSLLARVQQARGNQTEALALIQQATDIVRAHNMSHLTSFALALHALIHLRAGNLEAAVQWADHAEFKNSDTYNYLVEIESLIFTQIRIEQGKFSEASQLLEQILTNGRKQGRERSVIQALVQQAQLLLAQNLLDQAISVFSDALILAEPEQYIRTFLDGGKPIIALLRHAATRSITPNYTRKLLAACAESSVSAPLQSNSLLSERELTILCDIATGKTNQEIADEFVIAVSTVKTHLNNIYSKLGVHSRTQAIARAKELGLLS